LEGDGDPAFLLALGQRMRALRALRGMSRKALAGASGLSERYIAQLESGQGNVSILLLRRIARAMGLPLEECFPEATGSSEQPALRDLLRRASPDQLEAVRRLLTSSHETPHAGRGKRVALIGLRGAGKSTLGRIAAERLGWRFVELNREIERAAGLSVAEILALYGQEGYRRMEHGALSEQIAAPAPLLVATAGGIVSEPASFERLLGAFHTIWLRARPEDHMERVRAQGDLRPMQGDPAAMAELRSILVSREPLYARAHATLETSDRSLEEAAAALVALIRQA
jgi:XRE family aerobic/anaerobic benzoate catabolism transcriptional regulator